MAEAVRERFGGCDAVVMTAAVADFRPARPRGQKIKKGSVSETLTLELEPTEDILAGLGKRKGDRVLVGFVMETEDLEARARDKLQRKGLDLVVANSLVTPGAGFAGDTNVVTLLGKDGVAKELPCLSKDEVAVRIVDRLAALLRSAEDSKDSD
jgi:phosphopantothenoylcysteine decarboxylase/phosphopantothenate--cysteine ligase